jgi:hypothetical protein
MFDRSSNSQYLFGKYSWFILKFMNHLNKRRISKDDPPVTTGDFPLAKGEKQKTVISPTLVLRGCKEHYFKFLWEYEVHLLRSKARRMFWDW